jgi:hypothetical protein
MYYIYIIIFVDGFFYIGSKKGKTDNPLTDGYFGSPVAHFEKWKLTMYYKKIISTNLTREEANELEKKLIRESWNDPKCLNENCGGIISRQSCSKGGVTTHKKHPEQRKEIARKVGLDNVEQGRGFWKEGMVEIKSEIGKKHKENKTAIFAPGVSKRAGESCLKQKKGVHDPINKEKCRQGSIKSGKKMGPIAAKKLMEDGRGIHDPDKQHLRKEWASAGGKKGGKKGGEIVNNMRFMNTDERFPPHISTPAGLTNWQKARGIDPKNRKRVN